MRETEERECCFLGYIDIVGSGAGRTLLIQPRTGRTEAVMLCSPETSLLALSALFPDSTSRIVIVNTLNSNQIN